jgi:hypothetical protein
LEITVQLPDVEMEDVNVDEIVERYVEKVQPMLRQKISELVEQRKTLTGKDPLNQDRILGSFLSTKVKILTPIKRGVNHGIPSNSSRFIKARNNSFRRRYAFNS